MCDFVADLTIRIDLWPHRHVEAESVGGSLASHSRTELDRSALMGDVQAA